MGKSVLKVSRLFFGGTDFTSNNNMISMPVMAEEKETTSFGSDGWKEVIGGNKSFTAEGSGQWEADGVGKVDDEAWAELATQECLCVFPAHNQTLAQSAAVGDVCYFGKVMESSYQLGGSEGEVAPWTAKWSGSWPAVRGIGLHPPGTARTATGSGTAVEHVAVASGQYLYAGLNVISIAGTSTPTITVTIDSDATNAFSGAETQRLAFTADTTRDGEVVRVAGPITDTWYRAKWTITGTNPSFLFVVSLGIM